MTFVRPRIAYPPGIADSGATSQVESIPSLAVRLVVLESEKRQRPDVHRPPRVVRSSNRERPLEILRRRRLVTKSILVAFHRNVPHERVEAVHPPKTRPLIPVERKHLPRQWRALN